MIKDAFAAIIAAILATIGAHVGPEYSATMAVIGPAGTNITRISVRGEWQRQSQDGQMVILNNRTGKTYTIFDDERTYVETDGSKEAKEEFPENLEIGQILTYDGGTIERLPSEVFSGYRCRRYRLISSEDRFEQSIWYSPKLKAAIKVVSETPIGRITTEYRDIVEGPQDMELFSIPDGYVRTELEF